MGYEWYSLQEIVSLELAVRVYPFAKILLLGKKINGKKISLPPIFLPSAPAQFDFGAGYYGFECHLLELPNGKQSAGNTSPVRLSG